MIALAGDEIIADATSIVGSIGVVSGGFGFPELLKKIGVERRVYTAGENKVILDPFQPEKEKDIEYLKTLQLEIHQVFISMALTVRTALGAEIISSFNSDIRLEKSGAMTVAETITVNAEGNRIRRGIFRDFPLTFTDENGRLRSVDFDVVSVTRDGQDEPWKTESISGGIRIYAGSEDVMLSPGRHQYVFTYRTNRQIRYFADHDCAC